MGRVARSVEVPERFGKRYDIRTAFGDSQSDGSAGSTTDPGEVRQGSGQPIDLVDDDDLDGFALDLLQQGLKGRALNVSTRVAPIVKDRRG